MKETVFFYKKLRGSKKHIFVFSRENVHKSENNSK